MRLIALTEELPNGFTADITSSLVIVIPEEIRRFVVESKLPANTLEQLESIVIRLREYLELHGYANAVDLSLSTDPEYPEWKEIKIHAKIDGVTINEIYDKLWKDITNYAFEGISNDVIRQILLKLDNNS